MSGIIIPVEFTKQQALVAMITSGILMDRAAQQDVYEQYQEYSWNGNPREQLPDNLHIFFDSYEGECYEGDSMVWGYDTELQTFFYTSGSHCSCYGLEGQWGEEPYSMDEMVAKIKTDLAWEKERTYYNRSDRIAALEALLEIIE